ncbi:MAG TPA: MaoC family dehydratase [Pseudomonadales bacterium]|nr:MaoC family dehydratase [Pseudomonadales bacterium]
MPDRFLENKTFEELEIGATADFQKTINDTDLLLFGMSSGDFNPVHFDDEFAKSSQFGERIAHGMLLGSFFSALIANQLPGPGSVYVSQSLNFKRPVKLGDTVTVTVEILEKREKGSRVILKCSIKNQAGKECVDGQAEVIAPKEKLKILAKKPISADKLEAAL